MDRIGLMRSSCRWIHSILVGMFFFAVNAPAAVIEFNSAGGTTATNGLHFYIEDTTKIQVRRLNNTGQVYSSGAVPPSNSLDNGVFIRANGLVYGPSHTVTTFNPTGGMYNTRAITAASPANPSAAAFGGGTVGAVRYVERSVAAAWDN